MNKNTVKICDMNIRIVANPDDVFSAITTAGSISKWWTEDVQINAKHGGNIELGFSDGKIMISGLIQDYRPGQRFSILWEHGHEAYRNSIMCFEITSNNRSESTLNFSHEISRSWPDSLKDHYTSRWQDVLGNLKLFLEKGDTALPT